MGPCWHRAASRQRAGFLALLALALLLSACLERWARGSREAGSALWVTSDSGGLSGEQSSALAEVGIRDIFVQAGRLTWRQGTLEVEPLALPTLPSRSTVTLVLGGGWGGSGVDAQEAAATLVAAMRQLKIEAESRGLLPIGLHLDVGADSDLATFGEMLSLVRGDLARELLLSATIEAEWLDDEAIEEVAAPLQFVVAFLYGQPLEEPDDARFWDLDRLTDSARRLDELGRGFLVGVRLLGGLYHLDGDGDRLELARQADLQSLVEAPALEKKGAFLFEGFHRQVVDFEVGRPLRVGDWRLQRGHRLQVARPTAYHLRELHERLEQVALEHYLGDVYFRLVAPQENLSIQLDELLAGLKEEELSPDMRLGVSLEAQRGGRWIVRAQLRNRGRSGTSLALVDANYLELVAPEGIFGRVDLGRFQRMELGRGGTTGGPARNVRNADTLRLFYPLVDTGWGVESGPIEIRRQGELELELKAAFLLPGGRTYEVSRRWLPGQEEAEEGAEGTAAE